MKKTIKRICKKIVRKIVKWDKKYFSNRLYKIVNVAYGNAFDGGLYSRTPNRDYSYFYLHKNITEYRGELVYSKVVRIPVADLVRMQYNKHISHLFNRYDLAIRWLALDQMNGKNNFGQEWDNRMQTQWVGEKWDDRFANLYQSIKVNGFDDSQCIDTDWDMQLVDGSHRTAIALYTNKEFINVRLNSMSIPDVYTSYHGSDFLYRIGFDKKEISVVDEKLNEILDRCRYPFIGILWPASRELWDEILKDVNEYNPSNVGVLDYKDVVMTEDEINGFIKAVYYLDDVTEENLEKKRQYNLHSSRITNNQFPVRIVRLDIKNPYYRVKSVSGLPQSREIIYLKEAIRGHYAPYVYDYQRDVIFHIADNYLQSKFIWQLLQINRDITDFYKMLTERGSEAAVIKRRRYYSPPPTNDAHNNQFVFRTDLDILVDDKDVIKMLNLVKEFSAQHFGNIDWVEEEEIKPNFNPEYNKFYRIKMQGFSIFLFHIQSRYYELRVDYLRKLLANRRIDGIQPVVDQPEYEVYIRLADILHYPNKQHHIEYIKHFKHLLSEDGIKEAFEPHAIDKAKNKLKEILQ